MKIEQILHKITPEIRERELKKIQNVKLPKNLQRWVDEYKKAGGGRDDLTWKLFKIIINERNYLIIKKKYRKSFNYVHFLFAMFVVSLDDIVDCNKDKDLFKKAYDILFFDKREIPNFKKENRMYLIFILKLWHEINNTIKSYPNYQKYFDLFEYDVKQIFNSFEYDFVVNNKLYLTNKLECWLYSPQTMQFVFNDDIYLMCTKNCDEKEITKLRELFWFAKKMARIGNWVYTWKKELMKNDYSSGVFAYAISFGCINTKELYKNKYNNIARKIEENNIENILLCEWNENYSKIRKQKKNIRIIQVDKLLINLKKLIFYENVIRIK